MKITKLVILFNYKKLLLGVFVAMFSLWGSTMAKNSALAMFFVGLSVLILLNILISILAAYLLYDQSDLYRLEQIPDSVDLDGHRNGLFIHASFDSMSRLLEERYPEMDLVVCDIYENRHMDEKMIHYSKRIFPPNSDEIKINPTNLPFEDESQDIIFAITAVHEILQHEKRVAFFMEAKRVLRKNGVIILSEQMRNGINFLFFNIGAFHFLPRKDWLLAIDQSEMTIISTYKVSLFAETLIIKK